MTTHSRLAPSAAERWINCPASVAMNEEFPDTTSIYAAEGTVAHKLGELKINQSIFGRKPDKDELNEIYQSELYSPDMEDYTDEYVEYVRSLIPSPEATVLTETKLNLDFIVPNTSGIADCIIADGNDLHVVDLKYGKNVEIDAVNNPQLMIYALGACKLLDGLIYDIKNITIHIVQPRMNNFSLMKTTKDKLYQWLDEIVKPQAIKANENSLEIKSGKWCKFCRAKSICREYDKNFTITYEPKHPQFLNNQEIADRIKQFSNIPAHLKELEDYALTHILDGETFPGFKVVAGRSSRFWTDQDKAFQIAIDNGYDESILFTRKPLTLAQVEKVMGKKTFNKLLSDFVEKPIGKPTLVPENDPRESIGAFVTAIDDFKDIKF